MFIRGHVYRRRDLHSQFGGQNQGGISTPAGRSIVFLFTGESGEQYGYSDGWTDEGIFFYTGEGQRGDMSFVRGNSAVRDHSSQGKDLHLFSSAQRGHVRYEGQMVFTGFQYRVAPDIDGNLRQAIVFELVPLVDFEEVVTGEAPPDSLEAELGAASLEELRRHAISVSAESRDAVQRRSNTRHRSRAIKMYADKRADGICEGCSAAAPFRTSGDRPYLETHHIRRLSDGGPDHPRWVVAVCPNCHRRAHYAFDAATYNEHLNAVAERLEAKYGSPAY